MTNQIPQSALQKLQDREEIRSLRMRYSTLLDTGNTDQLDAVFSKDAEVVVTVGTMKGLAEIEVGLAEAYQSFDTQNRGHFPFVHAIANHEIDLTGPDQATGSCYLLDFVTDRPEERHPFLLLGRYQDQYARIDGVWRITRTALDVVWPNDASDA
ncbi:nuclear transport factor 2 family protein [Thalassospira sp. MA62]|nr:nuclear transport factor 2 family protein [Thalassospira sp. MA62]